MTISIATLGVDLRTDGLKKGEADLKRVESQGRRTADSLDDAGKRGSRGLSSIRDSASRASTAVAGLVAAFGFDRALRGIISITNEFTQLESRLRLVTDSSEQLAKVQNELQAISVRARGSYTGLTDLYVRLAQAGGELGASQAELLQFTEGVSNALTLSGASAQSASGALTQLSQALGGGIVRAEEFNSILEGAPEIARAVARNLDGVGGSIGRLRQEVVAGNVTSEAFFRAFLDGSEETSAAAQGMERTVSQAAQQFQNTLGLAISQTDMSGFVDSIDSLSDALSDPAVLDGLTTVASGIVTIADASAKAVAWLGRLGVTIGETAGELALQRDEMGFLEKAFKTLNPLALAYSLTQAKAGRDAKLAREEAESGARGVIAYVDGLTKLEGQVDLTGKAFFEFGKGAEQAGTAAEVLDGKVQAQIVAMRRVNELIDQGVERGAAEARVKLELAGATASQITEYLALREAIDATTKATETLSTAEADRLADLQEQIAFQTRINELMRDGRTESEARFVAEFEAADALTRQLMVQQQVTEGLANAQNEAARAATATAEASKRAQEEAATAAQRAADKTAAAAQRMRDELNRGITDGLLRGFEAGKSFADNFIDVLKAQFQALVLRPTISFIVSGIQGAISQIGGAAFSSLTGGGGIAGLLGGAGGGIGSAIFNGTLPLIDAIGNTFPTLASSLTNLSASLTALSPGMLTLGAAGAAGLFAVGRGLAVDNSRVGENVQGAAAVLNPLSLVASGLDRITGGGAFGTKFKTVGQELTLSVEDGVIESMLWVTQSRKRSGFRGRKWRAWSEEFNTEIFQAAFDSLAETAGQAARLAGTGLDLSATIQRDIFREENGAQLAFDDLATVIAERIVPGIRDFSREGETVASTFARITAQAQGLDAGLMGLNTSLSGVALFEQAERLTQVFGDQLSGSMSSLQSVLLTSEQQFENLRTVLSGALDEVGVALTDSRENLLGVVQGLDLTTESGIRAYEVLLAAAPQLGQFFDTLEQRQAEAAQEAERLAEEQRRAAEAALQAELALAAARQQQRRGLLDQIAVLTSLDPEMTQLEQRFRDLRAEVGNDVGLIELVNRLSELEVGALLAARAAETAAAAQQAMADAITAAQSRVSSAEQALEQAQEAQRNAQVAVLNEQIEGERARFAVIQEGIRNQLAAETASINARIAGAREVASASQALVGLLGGAASSVAGLSLSRSQALSNLQNIGAGRLRNTPGLERSVSAAQQFEPDEFASQIEMATAQSLTAETLAQLAGRAEKQLSADERTVDVLERSLTEAQARADRELAVAEAQHLVEIEMIDEQIRLINNTVSAIEQLRIANQGVAQAEAELDAARGELLRAQHAQLLSQGNTANSLASQQLSALRGIEGSIGAILSESVPGFASGGMHSGGLRVVGENGPELEATGPARIWNQQQIGAAVGGSSGDPALRAEVAALRREVASLTNAMTQTARNTARSANTLDRVETQGIPVQVVE